MKPLEDNARLNELSFLNILDTPPEERFDRHTRLVFRAVNSLTDIGYNVSLSINKNRFPLCPNLQRPLT